jgi:hypothetical protein
MVLKRAKKNLGVEDLMAIIDLFWLNHSIDLGGFIFDKDNKESLLFL